jgi:hypothetical protein
MHNFIQSHNLQEKPGISAFESQGWILFGADSNFPVLVATRLTIASG